MKNCSNPFCSEETYDPDRDGSDASDFCPQCFKTTCIHCGGWHDGGHVCPLCRDTGFNNCIFDDVGDHCLGCPFKGCCNWYDENRDALEQELYEERLLAIHLGK